MNYRKTAGLFVIAFMLTMGLQACQQEDQYEAEYQPRPDSAQVQVLEARSTLESVLGRADMRIDSLENELHNAEAGMRQQMRDHIQTLRSQSAQLESEIDSLSYDTATEFKAEQDSLRMRIDALQKAIDQSTSMSMPPDSMKASA